MRDALGEANMLFAEGEFGKARERLLEVIRLCPDKPDAFHTLGLIHGETGEPEKALECFIIAAHLTPRDPEQWRRLAEMSREQDKPTQAIYCLNKALRMRNTHELLWEKAMLLIETHQPKKAIEALTSLLNRLPSTDSAKGRGTGLENERVAGQKLEVGKELAEAAPRSGWKSWGWGSVCSGSGRRGWTRWRC